MTVASGMLGQADTDSSPSTAANENSVDQCADSNAPPQSGSTGAASNVELSPSSQSGILPHADSADMKGESSVSKVRQASAETLFRSNVEAVEQPRQMVVLFATIAVASYLGFSQNDTDPEANTRAATMAVSFLFCVHCFLQCRDTLFVRPHPGVWRLVHAMGMLYLFGVAILLTHPKDEARRLLSTFIPDMKGYTVSQADFEAGDMDCTLTVGAIVSQLREVWFLAHLVGWWCKMCLFRDWGVCWALSIGFEMLELSMGWLVPQFHECWWDSLIIDLLGANLMGMTLGLYTLRFLETRTYDWNRTDGPSGKLARSMRLLSRFSPFNWSKWRWQAFSSFKRTAQVFALVAATMILELNAFMMMNALEVPKTSNFNYVRLTVVFLVGLLGVSEYYEYCSTSTNRLGQNAWLLLAIMQVEILTWIKFFPQPLKNASSPAAVKIPWLAFLSLFSLWALLFFAVSKESQKPSWKYLLESGRSSLMLKGDSRGADGTDRSRNSNGNGSGDDPRPASSRDEIRRCSFSANGGKPSRVVQLIQWGLVDAVFVLSFIPLLYLVRQWSY